MNSVISHPSEVGYADKKEEGGKEGGRRGEPRVADATHREPDLSSWISAPNCPQS